MDKDGRVFWLDATRVVAIFGVVLLHTAAPHLYQFGTGATRDWHIANSIDAFVRPSVPLFFMVSGAVLLERSIGISQLKPRVMRLIVPLVVWSILYLLMLATIKPNFDLIGSLLRAPVKPVMYHLWFLYALIGLYLCLPLVGPAIRAASPTQLYYGLGLWMLASALIPTFEAILDVQSSIEISTMAGYMGYMVLGHMIAKAPAPSRRHVYLALALMAIGYGVTATGTALVSVQKGRFINLFYGYFSPNLIMFSVGAFVIIRAVFEGRQIRLVRALSDLSFGIFLCHVAVLTAAYAVFDIRGWWIIPFAVLAFAVSALGAFVARRLGLARVLAP